MITLHIDAGLAHLTLARAEAGNAMNRDLIERFAAVCEQVAADRSVRAVLIDAQGKNFCVGGDIRAFAEERDAGAFIEQLAGRLHDGLALLATIDAPVIAAVQGAAAGAGLSLAVSADLVLAGQGASFALAYTGIGLTSDGGATWSLPRLIGLRRTQEMAYLNRRLSAAEAQEWGLITGVVADEDLAAEALATARRIAAGPTLAFGGVKRLLRASFGAELSDQLGAEARAIGAAMRTSDAQDAIQAFLAREAPVFTGR